MKVLHIAPRYLPCLLTGSEMYMRYLSEGLAKNGASVTMLTSNCVNLEGFLDPIRGRFLLQYSDNINGVTVIRYNTLHIISLPMFLIERYINLKNLFPRYLYDFIQVLSTGPLTIGLSSFIEKKAANYDLLHCTPFPLTVDYQAATSALKAELPLVITPFFHFENKIFYNTRLTNLLRQADAVLACTKVEKQKIVEVGVKANKIHLVPMGINPEEWKNANGKRFREKYGLNPAFIVFFAGTKVYEKGAITLLKAMRIVQKKKQHAVLVTAGFGFNDWAKMKQTMNDVKILDLPYISGENKLDAFDACDIFAMPSRSDAFGISYLEAWVCGKPVIGARAGATCDVIHDSIDGFLVEFGDEEELAQKILYLMDHPEIRESLGNNGKKYLLNNYTWSSIINKVDSIYHDVASKSRT